MTTYYITTKDGSQLACGDELDMRRIVQKMANDRGEPIYIGPEGEDSEDEEVTPEGMLQEAIDEAWDEVRASLTELVESLKKDIGEEYRSPGSEDDGPSMQLTIGHNLSRCKTDPEFVEDGWTYQTGDNSFTGGAYSRPDWAVVDLTPDCDAEGVVDEILSQFSELEAM